MEAGETPREDGAASSRDKPPLAFWLLPAAIALLRALPYQHSLVMETPPGMAALQVGYIPKDMLAYLSFIRQVAEDGGFLLFNQFTTEPQTPRFVLVLHWLLGSVSRLLGWAPSQVLELSRVPLIFVFFAVLWSFLRPILPERRTRLMACVLIGLSGGVDWLVEPLLALISPLLGWAFGGATQDVYGWSTFEVLFNPLWVAALSVALVALGPILAPSGPRRARDFLAIGLGFLLLVAVHAYSAILVLSVAATLPLVELVFTRELAWRRHARIWLALLPSIGIAGALSWWQSQDPVYRAASGNVFGPEATSVFWYPFTLGATLLLALVGAQTWIREQQPYRFALFAWIGAVVWLHTSPLLNGYHFLLYLHLPLCILAATTLDEVWAARPRFQAVQWAGASVLAVALFASPVAVTVRAVEDVERHNLFPAAYGSVLVDLQQRPPGNALVPALLGNLVPAFTPHRVWLGHWFLTPDVRQRTEQYDAWTNDPVQADDLRRIVAQESIDYLVVPHARADVIAAILGDSVAERESHGDVDLFVLRSAPGAGQRDLRSARLEPH